MWAKESSDVYLKFIQKMPIYEKRVSKLQKFFKTSDLAIWGARSRARTSSRTSCPGEAWFVMRLKSLFASKSRISSFIVEARSVRYSWKLVSFCIIVRDTISESLSGFPQKSQTPIEALWSLRSIDLRVIAHDPSFVKLISKPIRVNIISFVISKRGNSQYPEQIKEVNKLIYLNEIQHWWLIH